MNKLERNKAQYKSTPARMKNSREFVMEWSSEESRLARRVKAGKVNGNKFKRNTPYLTK
jgi:very-short-patch-repair endonuclease